MLKACFDGEEMAPDGYRWDRERYSVFYSIDLEQWVQRFENTLRVREEEEVGSHWHIMFSELRRRIVSFLCGRDRGIFPFVDNHHSLRLWRLITLPLPNGSLDCSRKVARKVCEERGRAVSRAILPHCAPEVTLYTLTCFKWCWRDERW